VLVALALVLVNMNNAYAENAALGADDSGALLAGQPKDAPEGEGGLMVISEDGVTRYSTDGGASWTEGYPEGAEVQTDAQGRTTVSMGADTGTDGSSSASGTLESDNLAITVDGSGDGGVLRYSTDGGVTWSEQVPDGVETVTEEADGKVTVSMGKGPLLAAQQGGTNAD
jgi:hypothetical protein